MGRLFFLLGAVFGLVSAIDAADYRKLIDFSDSESVQTMTFGTRKDGLCDVSYDSVRRCVVVRFDSKSNVSLSLSGFAKVLDTRASEVPKDAFYFKYRAPELDAHIEFKVLASDAVHASVMPFAPGPDLSFATVRPRMGWHQRGVRYDPNAIQSIYFVFSGKGVVEFYEAGVLLEPPRPKVPPRDWTPIRPDAFMTFPEPRILKKLGGTVRLPKKVRMRAGELPQHAKNAFVRELRDYHGIVCEETDDSADLSFALKSNLSCENVKVVRDGFAIRATPDAGVKVVALDPAGLVWGAEALSELMFRASLHTMEGGASGCTWCEFPAFVLVDWPRMGVRVWEDAVHSFWHTCKYDVPFYIEMLERVPLAARYNLFSHYSDVYYKWSAPGMSREGLAWTQDEYGMIVDEINGYGAEMMPFVQSLGHQDYFILRTPDLAARYGEDGKRGVLCTRNPETYPLLFGMFDDMIRSCSRNRKPRFFFIGLDEVRWLTHAVEESERCKRCAGVPKNRIFLEHVRKCRDYLSARGLRTVMSADMVTELHNGRDRFNCAAIVDELPKDVVLAPWSNLDNVSISDYRGKGFDQWKIYTGFHSDPTGEDDISGYGIGIFVFNWWLSRTRGCSNGPYGILAQFLTAHHAWREAPLEDDEGPRLARKWGNFLMRRWSRKPIGRGTYETIGLTGRPFDVKGFDAQTHQVDGIPVKLGEIATATGASVSLPVRGRAKALAFLHGAEIEKSDLPAFFKTKRDALKGPVIANYHVTYADGSEAQIPVSYGWNVGDIVSNGKTSDCFTRYLMDCRFTWINVDDDRCLYLYEWRNPFPEKEISSVTLGAVAESVMSYRVFAVSAKR